MGTFFTGSGGYAFLSINSDGEVKLEEQVDREKFGDDDSLTVVFVAIEEDCLSNCKSENATSIIRIIVRHIILKILNFIRTTFENKILHPDLILK